MVTTTMVLKKINIMRFGGVFIILVLKQVLMICVIEINVSN